jgi:hypothetical protein
MDLAPANATGGVLPIKRLALIRVGTRAAGLRETAKWLRLDIAGPAINPVQVFRTCRDLHWEFLRLWTGFELPSSWLVLPGYGSNRNRNSFCVMR